MTGTTRMAALLLAVGSSGLLGGALAFQYLGDLHPCVLCVYQRWPHAAVVILALLAFPLSRYRRSGQALILAAALVLVVGAGIAAYHVGVEQRWWQGTTGCSGMPTADTASELLQKFRTQQVAACDQVPWSLFGISMAGYNLLFSAVLAVLAVLFVRNEVKGHSQA